MKGAQITAPGGLLENQNLMSAIVWTTWQHCLVHDVSRVCVCVSPLRPFPH